MAYIQPNSTITLYKNVPLDSDYEHTIWFKGTQQQTPLQQQNAYFAGLPNQVTFNHLTYIRDEKESIRLEISSASLTYADLYKYNYMRFTNTSYENKWIYCFLTEPRYISDKVIEFTFEVDLMQTWAFEYTLEPSFVEREHASTDTIGDNLIPEDFETGEYVTQSNDVPTDSEGYPILSPLSIVIGTNREFDSGGAIKHRVVGTYYSHLFQGLEFQVFNNNLAGATAAEAFLLGHTFYPDSIVTMFLMPTALIPVDGQGDPDPTGEALDYTFSYPKYDNTYQYQQGQVTRTGGFGYKNDYYSPYNMKLYTYPYNFLYITNFNGTGVEYPYEYFDSNACTFYMTGLMKPDCEVIMAPEKYKGTPLVNWDEKITLDTYPQLSFNRSDLAQKLASIGIQGALTAAGGLIGAGLGASAANQLASSTTTKITTTTPKGAVKVKTITSEKTKSNEFSGKEYALSNSSSIATSIMKAATHSSQPSMAGRSTGASTLASVGLANFGFMHKHIMPEFARIIDNYFSMYGYATHKVKVPNTCVRKRWTYVKTTGCNILPTGSGIPANDLENIQKIYDRGITFWKYRGSDTHVGVYNFADNAIE